MEILYVNACARENSRTKVLASHILSKLSGNITELDLDKERIKPLYSERLSARDLTISRGAFDNDMFRYARQFAAADEIVIAAPYWDLSFSAVLKNYIESINVIGITFSYSELGVPGGLCRAKRLIYVTTAGGRIVSDELGYGYIKTLCNTFYGIKSTVYVKAEGLDIEGADIYGILKRAIADADKKL